jgi:hypothetical protein
MLAAYELLPLSCRAVCAHGEVDYEYEDGLTYDELMEQLEQRAQISHGSECYEISWHEPTQRVFINAPHGEFFLKCMSDEFFPKCMIGINSITMRNVIESLELPSQHLKLDWYEDDNGNLENVLDTPVKTVPVHQLSINLQ